MAVSEIRTQIYLQRSQHSALKKVAAQRSVSLAQVVREAVAQYLGDASRTISPNANHDPAFSLLSAVDEIGGSGDADGSSRVEEDLYGSVGS